jgi:hypothetical protein
MSRMLKESVPDGSLHKGREVEKRGGSEIAEREPERTVALSLVEIRV